MQKKKVVKRVDLNILDVYLEESVGKWIKRISCERMVEYDGLKERREE